MKLPAKRYTPPCVGRFSAALSLVLALLLSGCTLGMLWEGATADASESAAEVISELGLGTGRPVQDEVRLDVENILQEPELPNGCEATSLAILLNYLGYPADKMDLAYSWIPREEFYYTDGNFYLTGADPESAYPGDPGTEDGGFYCFTAPVVQAANNYLRGRGAGHVAMDISGAGEEALVALLDAGLPLMVWKSRDGQPPQRKPESAWLLANGELYEPIVNLHVVVLAGYDGEAFYMCDPLGGQERLERGQFMAEYGQMGSRAVAFALGAP